MSLSSCFILSKPFVDKMNDWFKSDEFKELGRLVKYIFAQYLSDGVRKLLKKKCLGCEIDHPSQSQHICIQSEPNKDPFLLYLYAETMESIDLDRMEDIYHRTRMILKIGYGSNDPHQDFSLHIKSCVRSWFISDFASLDSDLCVDPDISKAVHRKPEMW